jgi:hypothetical protein
MSNELNDVLDQVYNTFEGNETMREYDKRHGIDSLAVLTVYDDNRADLVASYLAPRIEGRIVVEIGGGIGLLAFHLAQYAKRVYCIEANPMWSWTFAKCLMDQKPKNVSYLFGAADEFAGQIRGDVALYCTHSDAAGMFVVGKKFAPTVIDVYAELVEPEWNALRAIKK